MHLLTRRDMIRATGLGAAALALPPAVFGQEAEGFTLPKLPYAYDALEPHIDARTMEIHHQRHHNAYVSNLNKALAGTDWAGKPLETILASLSQLPEKIRTAVRNNGGGHYNHSQFWVMMSPEGGKPTADLTTAINDAFGSMDDMAARFKEAAMGRFGSGWAWLVAGAGGKLQIASSPNQDNPLMDQSGTPLLGIDVWEHAYYLKYQNMRAAYVDAFMKVVNWEYVSSRFADVKKG